MKQNIHKNTQRIKQKLERVKLSRTSFVSAVVVLGIALLGVHLLFEARAASNPPTVAISNLSAGGYVHSYSQAVDVTATPNDGGSDTSGSISSCTLSVNSAIVGSPITTAPYNFTLNTINYANGTISLSVSCTDDQGDIGTTNLSLVVNNGDLNNAGSVGIFDLTTLASNWGKSGETYAQGNITGNSAIGIYDLSEISKNWGWTAPVTTYSCTENEPGVCYFPADTVNFVGMNNPYVTYSGTSSLGTVVANNFHNPISGETQSIEANSASQWEVINNTPTNPSGGITDYPSNGIYSYTGILDDYSSLTQTYNLTMPIAGVNGTNTNSISWATSDDWLSSPGQPDGSYTYEVQVHVDTSDYTGGHTCGSSVVASNVSLGGSLWLVCSYQQHNADGSCPGTTPSCGEIVFVLGGTYANRVAQTSVSGSIDLKAIFQWLENNDVPSGFPGAGFPYMAPGSSISALSRGWEIVSTGGATQTFTMNSFTTDAVGAPTPLSSAPTNVTFTQGAAGTCVASWNAVSGATAGYDLWSGATGYVRIASGTTYTISGTSGTPLGGVEVAATSNGGPGPYSGFTDSCTPS